VVTPRCATSAAAVSPWTLAIPPYPYLHPSAVSRLHRVQVLFVYPSLWPTPFVQDYNPSPAQFSPIVSSYTPLLQPLQYPPPSPMPSKIIATFTPWLYTCQRAARAFWSVSLACAWSTVDLTLLCYPDPRQFQPALGFDVWPSRSTAVFRFFTTRRSRGSAIIPMSSVQNLTRLQRLYDRMWFFVTESLLAFTIFRDEIDIPLAVMFCFLLFVKSFHWLLSDRIEWVFAPPITTISRSHLHQMNQMPYPGPTTLFHIRISGLFFLLWVTNIVMLAFAAESILTNGVGVIILFASEVSIIEHVSPSATKFLLVLDPHGQSDQFKSQIYPFYHRIPPCCVPWRGECTSMGGQKHVDFLRRSDHWYVSMPLPGGRYLTHTEDFLKLSTYLGFFAVIVTFYGVPLNVVRDVYVTARSFITRLRDLMRYRTATRNMDERYPNATQEEMSAMSDHTCIICREEMVLPDPATRDQTNPPGTTAPVRDGPNMTPKKLPCGHIFHFHCLRSWLERQQSCPTWSVRLITLLVSRVDALV